jgi:hypothetical protein
MAAYRISSIRLLGNQWVEYNHLGLKQSHNVAIGIISIGNKKNTAM